MITRSKSPTSTTLTTVRQLCLSADLIPANYVQYLKQVTTSYGPAVSAATLTPEQRERVIEKLRQGIADQEECSVGRLVDVANIADLHRHSRGSARHGLRSHM